MQRKTLWAVYAYFQSDIAIPWIFCHLVKAHLTPIDLHVHLSLSVVMDPNIIGPRGIKVPAQACQRARQIRRTAGTGEPALAVVMSAAGQGVFIEKARAIQ